MQEPSWLRYDVIIAIHQMQIAEHGGKQGVRDEGLLKSALDRPLNAYHYQEPKPDLAFLAASYAYGIARNHPFIDGNKRTAFVALRLFLKINQLDLKASQQDKYTIIMKLASGRLSESELADWIEKNQIEG